MMELSFLGESLTPATEGPKFTQPQDRIILKSTRHLLFSEVLNFYHNTSSGYKVDVIPEVQDLTGRITSESTDQVTYSACDPNPCQNGGKCEKLPNSDGFQCHCPDLYGGLVCSDMEEFKGKPNLGDTLRDYNTSSIIYIFTTYRNNFHNFKLPIRYRYNDII